MRLLETNDWILLNNMIYKIYTTSNADEMRLQFMEQLRLLIDFDSAEFSMASADGKDGQDEPVVYSCGPDERYHSLRMELNEEKEMVGVVTLYRAVGKEDFAYDDIFILNSLKDHLAYRLYQYKKFGSTVDGKLTVRAASEKFRLTRREETILRLLMDGRENAAICEELGITDNTLKKHILNIYRKLGIRNRVGLFKMIREKGETA